MIPPKERCGACIVDKKCMANDVIYFSFLVPLHQPIVYDFVIGCATGQSFFVAIEQRCQCLIWASVPSDTILASYCLFEVLIDTSNGGTFPGCQFVIDHLFRTFQISNNISLNRIPYAIKQCPTKTPRIQFVSTLKKMFQTDTFCNLIETNREKFDLLRRNERKDLKHNIMTKETFLLQRKRHIAQFQNVGERCPEGSSFRDKLHKMTKKADGRGILKSGFKTRNALNDVTLDLTMQDVQDLKASPSIKVAESRYINDLDNTHSDNTKKSQASNTGGRATASGGVRDAEALSAFNTDIYVTLDLDDLNHKNAQRPVTTSAKTSQDNSRSPASNAPTSQSVGGPQSSSVSIHCTSTSNTERLVSPRLVTGLGEMEVRGQPWTPTPISRRDEQMNRSTNKSNNTALPNAKMLLVDWENRLYFTIKKYLFQDIF